VVVVAIVVMAIAAIAVRPIVVSLQVATVMMLVSNMPDRVVGPVAGLSHRGHGEGRDGSQSHHCLGQS
jgi:hypothetical protein